MCFEFTAFLPTELFYETRSRTAPRKQSIILHASSRNFLLTSSAALQQELTALVLRSSALAPQHI